MSRIEQTRWDALSKIINRSKTVVLITHVNADGDGLGSQIAFYYYLISEGKDCRIINPTPIQENYKIIDPELIVETYSKTMKDWVGKVDLAIIFDIGDYRRVGEIGDLVYGRTYSVSIDHHPVKKDHPFKLNLVDVSAPATGYLIWKYFQNIGYANNKMSLLIANALYASIVTDTGSFKYQSTTSDTHYMAAQLLECGIDGYAIQKEIYEQRKISQIKLLGNVISLMKFSLEDKIASVIVTQKMIIAAGGSDGDTEGLTDFMRSINNVEISFLILEKKDDSLRINFRSSGNYSINDVANLFDGGGHKFASGATVNNSTSSDVEKKILEQLSKKIKGI